MSLENHTAVYCVVTQNPASEKYCVFRSCKVTLTSCGAILLRESDGMSSFSGAFVKPRKATISFVMSVCQSARLSVRLEKFGSHWTDSDEI